MTAGIMALLPSPGAMDAFLRKNAEAGWFEALNATSGTGGLILWPLFGASNQLLAGLALMVITFYLLRRSRPVALVMIPGMLMLVMPAWAMVHKILQCIEAGQWHLVVIGVAVLALEAWMVIEAILTWRGARGQREPALPELPPAAPAAERAEDFVEVNP